MLEKLEIKKKNHGTPTKDEKHKEEKFHKITQINQKDPNFELHTQSKILKNSSLDK